MPATRISSADTPTISTKLGMPTTPPQSRPALLELITKPASTFSRMCPAIIATNSRRPRLNGRNRNDTSSIGKMMIFITSGVPCGTNRLKNFRPCLKKPTTSTIPKLMMASTPVMVKWLVKVKG